MRIRGRFFFTPSAALLRRVAIYGSYLFLLAVFQTSLPFIPLFEGALPNLTLAAVAAIGFFDSERAGGAAGIAAGFLLDALGCVTVSLMPLAGLAAGYICGIIAGRLLPRALPPFSLCLAGVSLMNMFLTLAAGYAAVPDLSPSLLIFRTLLPELLFTFVFGIPAALLSFLCVKLAGRTGRGREKK